MSEIEDLTQIIRDFAARRDWEKFHTPKNLAMAITGEACELASEFQWLTCEESQDLSKESLENIRLEIADVAIYLFRLCDVLKVNLSEAVKDKVSINEVRFLESK